MPMLTIKTETERTGYFRRLKLTVKGRLIRDWAEFLGREVAAYGAMGYPVVLDLAKVEEIDETGHAVLEHLAERGVQTVAGPAFTSSPSYSLPTTLAFAAAV